MEKTPCMIYEPKVYAHHRLYQRHCSCIYEDMTKTGINEIFQKM